MAANKVGAVCEGGIADFGIVDKPETGGNEAPEGDANWVLDKGDVLAVERVGAVCWEDGNITDLGVAEEPENGGDEAPKRDGGVVLNKGGGMAAGLGVGAVSKSMWVAGFGAEGIEGGRVGTRSTGAGNGAVPNRLRVARVTLVLEDDNKAIRRAKMQKLKEAITLCIPKCFITYSLIQVIWYAYEIAFS